MKPKQESSACYLAAIIDKYSATPEYDPEIIPYVLRPIKEEYLKKEACTKKCKKGCK